MKLLHKPLSYAGASYTAPNTWTLTPGGASNMQQSRILVSASTYFILAQSTYFDLAGLSKEGKTIFFQSLSAQQYGINYFEGATVGDSYLELILYSSVPYTDAELPIILAAGPGGQGSSSNWEQIPYWRRTDAYLGLDQGGYQTLIHQAVTVGGSGAPTASDRIYVYRIVQGTFAAPAAGTTNSISAPTTCVMVVDEKAEPEYQYLMRLKKSYDLQQSSDVDGNRPH